MGCRICTSHGKNVYEPEDVDIVLDKKETSREVIKI